MSNSISNFIDKIRHVGGVEPQEGTPQIDPQAPKVFLLYYKFLYINLFFYTYINFFTGFYIYSRTLYIFYTDQLDAVEAVAHSIVCRRIA